MPFIVPVMGSWYAILFGLVGYQPAAYGAPEQTDIHRLVCFPYKMLIEQSRSNKIDGHDFT